jgi:hypothetical protein
LLLEKVAYFSEAQVKKFLVDQNNALMSRLEADGLLPNKFIYVQVDEAGSSSPVMLNLLRDSAGLQQRGCHLLDSRDISSLISLTNSLGEGAIIYVDDFLGSGMQFCQSRDFTA